MTQGIPPTARSFAARLVDHRLALKRWRQRLKDRLPFVRRSVHRRLEGQRDRLAAALRAAPEPADRCAIAAVKAPAGALGPELCLFVTYSPQPRLKRHVVRHVRALQSAGVRVILIVNTPLAPERIEVDPPLRDALAGLYVRENVGFDFAAWAHVWLLLQDRLAGCERLLLANDSLVGPLRNEQLAGILERIRGSGADVVGLTANLEPRLHLQSFFLAFGRRALASPAFARFWRGVRILPAKELVVHAYEAGLTEELAAEGLRCEPLFRLPGAEAAGANDVYFRWPRLIEAGFPFVKASVLEEAWGSRAVRALVPSELLDEYEFANAGGAPRRREGARGR